MGIMEGRTGAKDKGERKEREGRRQRTKSISFLLLFYVMIVNIIITLRVITVNGVSSFETIQSGRG